MLTKCPTPPTGRIPLPYRPCSPTHPPRQPLLHRPAYSRSSSTLHLIGHASLPARTSTHPTALCLSSSPSSLASPAPHPDTGSHLCPTLLVVANPTALHPVAGSLPCPSLSECKPRFLAHRVTHPPLHTISAVLCDPCCSPPNATLAAPHPVQHPLPYAQ